LLASTYSAYAADLAPAMAEVCGPASFTLPPFAALDRGGFIDLNLLIARRLLEPVERMRSGLGETNLTVLGRMLSSRYVGELFGLMSQRVLGQFDPVLMLPGPSPAERPAGSLYLVESNVELFERAHGLPAEPLRRWLILHELTHAWQFGSHPWLAAHLEELMSGLVMQDLAQRLGAPRRRNLNPELLRDLGKAVGGQLRGVGQIQATMSVLEGYSNFVMHRVGRRQIAGSEELEKAFSQRQSERSLLERLVFGVTGIAVKLRQYQAGERFCVAVVAEGGVELLNRVWEGPGTMPSLAELRAPARWVARVGR